MSLSILIAEKNKEVGSAETMFIRVTPVTAVRQMAANKIKKNNFIY